MYLYWQFPMDIYKWLKIIGLKRIPAWTKLAGLAAMVRSRKRCLGVFVDPVMACNLRCMMCYFSDPDKRATLKGILSDRDIERMENLLLPHALKLQIGCGAEPSLFPNLPSLIRGGKRKGVPYISITTNAQLIGSGKLDIKSLTDAGLDEITLSLHGTQASTYEKLMPGASFLLLLKAIEKIRDCRRDNGKPSVRVNFTINSENITDLKGEGFFNIWEKSGLIPDIVQLRPVQKIGESAWTDFDLTPLKQQYSETIGHVADECRKKGITVIAPSLDEIDAVEGAQNGAEALIEDVTYCYVGPDAFYKDDFNPEEDTFASYHKRNRTVSKLIKSAFKGAKARDRNVSKKLNYRIS